MRLLKRFACMALLFILATALRSASAQDGPSLEETKDWIRGHLIDTQTGTGSVSWRYTSVSFPDTQDVQRGCVMQTVEEQRASDGTSLLTHKVYFNLVYYPVKVVHDASGYQIHVVQAAPPSNSDGPFAYWIHVSGQDEHRGTHGFLSASSSQEDAERIASAVNNLIKLCGGKHEAF